jgi:hypothetical protein
MVEKIKINYSCDQDGWTIGLDRFVCNILWPNYYWDPKEKDEKEEEKEEKKETLYCSHEWVNVGFNHIKMVCKHCDIDKKD